MKIKLPKSFKEIVESDKNNFLLYGGRLGGKTNNATKVATILMFENPYFDIVVMRANYGSISDSSYAEFESAIEEDFSNYKKEFTFRKSPLRIQRRNNSGSIYFMGYGGSNTSRTKGLKTKHKVIAVIMEETQELKEKRNFDEAMASVRRLFGDNVKVFVLGNPQPQKTHWFSMFIEEKKMDNDWLVKNLTWMDIVPFINDFDLKEILKTKLTNPEYYRWFYLGESTGGWNQCYPMFSPRKNEITIQQWEQVKNRSNLRIVGCVIGLDGAVTNDMTSASPLLLLNNGQAIVGPIFRHDPKEDGIISYHILVERLLFRWLEDVCRRFNLTSARELREHPEAQRLPIWLRCDSAAPDLIKECQFFFGDRVNIAPIKKSTILHMVSTVQSAIANDNIVVLNFGGYYNYTRNVFVKKQENVLSEQLESLVWNESQTGYDPIIPNDIADGFTYGCFFWFSNMENIQYFNIIKQKGIKNLLVCDIIKKIRQEKA